MYQITISPFVFEAYPSFSRGLVIARNIDNQIVAPELIAELNAACDQASIDAIDLKSDPRIVDWDNAHLAFNSNPNRFPPAHKALIKRVQKPGVQLPAISAVIAIMNINSIRNVIPVGGDDWNTIPHAVELKPANGDEVFVPLGQSDVVEHPEPGEIIYWHPASNQVMCRRWNWRNSHSSRITENTTAMIMNIDGLGDDSEARALTTRDSVAEMLEKYTNATVTVDLLNKQNPTLQIEG